MHLFSCLSGIEIPFFSSCLPVNRNKNNMDLVDDPRDFEVVTGGRHDVEAPENSLKIQDLGRYAVDEYNKEKNALLEFDKVVNAQTQVVCGLMTHLTLEVKDGDKKNVYKAGVLEQPWMSFKGLRYFSLVE